MNFKQWLLSEEIFPQNNTATVYHRTKSVDSVSNMLTQGFRIGEGCLYGCGLYTTFDINSNIDDANVGIKTEIGSTFTDALFTIYKISGAVGSETKTALSGFESLNANKFYIPKFNDSTKIKDIQFEFSFNIASTDIFTNPGILEYFRIYS